MEAASSSFPSLRPYWVNNRTRIDNCVTSKMFSQVSWVRRSGDKMHLLSYGQQVYSSDDRYEMQFRKPTDWQLRIQYANERDEGHYECQVSSHPPIVFHVHLKIIGKFVYSRCQAADGKRLQFHIIFVRSSRSGDSGRARVTHT